MMARWHFIPVLIGPLLAGNALAQPVTKPGAAVAAPSYESAAPRGRIARNPVQAEVTPAPVFVPPPPAQGGRAIQRASPSDPFNGVTLPRQSGDAAYQGGGVVLEQDDRGVNRRIR